MIIVTGTKRSGTSMWMQLMKAAGFPPLGNEFPKNWESTIKEANPEGFYESELRNGIYFATNPNPKTGFYIPHNKTQRVAVKVFVPGVIKTDIAYMDRVLSTMRPWHEYVDSLGRLYSMEKDSLAKKDGPKPPPSVYMPSELEWWVENFSLISDVVTRQYPFYMVTYHNALHETEATLRPIFEWLGGGDVEAAVAQVKPDLRTQDESKPKPDVDVSSDVLAVFDEFFELVNNHETVTQPFVDKLNETNGKLEKKIEAAQKKLATSQRERRKWVAEMKRKKKTP